MDDVPASGGPLSTELQQPYRKRPRQARSRRTVDALLDAAESVLRTHGYALASTNRIARAAGLSVGSLYQYFGHKDGLIGAAIERMLAREAEDLVGIAEGARALPLGEGVARLVDAALQGRLRRRHLLAVLSEHGLRFGPGTPIDLVSRHQRADADPLRRLVLARRGELREAAALETARSSCHALLNSASLAWAVESPAGVSAEGLARLLAAAIERHLAAVEPARAPAEAAPAPDLARLGGLLAGACDSSDARAVLLDALIDDEEERFARLAADGADAEAICRALLSYWSAMGAALAGSAGATTLSGPCLDPEAWRARAERRARWARGWLEGVPGRDPGVPVVAAAFVVGRGLFDLGLQLSLARQREERIADAAALLARCVALTTSTSSE
jgi:AcrR family transcriptional regulator